ncbi:MAG: TIGR01777 family protein [Chloroflexi bacterium]|nr:TIGR01777 family protein [Chloroflexota bacterium]
MTRVVIGGGTGLIGRALTAALIADGFEVDVLTRRAGNLKQPLPGPARAVAWSPRDHGGLAALALVLAGADAVVNLTGVPVGPLPWTTGRRRSILESRVAPTKYLVEALALVEPRDRPPVFVSASGIDGYMDLDGTAGTQDTDVHGTAGTQDTDVHGTAGTEDTDLTGTTGFLADVGRAWEASAAEAKALGTRVVMVRTAVVLARNSTLLPLLALPVRLGVGGRFGDGRQWFSWVHLDDLVAAYQLAIRDAGIAGPLIAAAPEPCRQRDLVATMARILRRPNWLPIPGWVLRLVLREEATLLLGSRRVVPARLLDAGFAFRYPDLDAALREALARPSTM